MTTTADQVLHIAPSRTLIQTLLVYYNLITLIAALDKQLSETLGFHCYS